MRRRIEDFAEWDVCNMVGFEFWHSGSPRAAASVNYCVIAYSVGAVKRIAVIESKPKSDVGVTAMSPIAHPFVSASPALCLSLTGFANSDKNFSIQSSSLNDVSIEVTHAL